MKVFVTGAGGFLGRAVVQAAVAAGHEVRAMRRPASGGGALPDGVEAVAGDLRQRGAWVDALDGCDAVVHCAAAASGDLATQLAGTVVATENLLAALPASVRRIVHISSFSVYDFDRAGTTLDEATPLEADVARRDAYTLTKLQQERMVRVAADATKRDLVVIRPGAIYGPGKDWDFGRTMRVGRFDLIFAPRTRMRLVHVDNCADAIVAALGVPLTAPLTVNLVDDEQPTHRAYHRLAAASGADVGTPISVPYPLVMGLGHAARLASRLFFQGKARLPELLDLPRQRVRWKPLSYDNGRAKAALGWTPRVRLDDGVRRLR